MIKQFNFYDIYGYLLPGVVLLGILWLPIGIVTKAWPDQDLSKALFLAALAYIVGHLIQSVAGVVVPSTIEDELKQRRAVSDVILDKGEKPFTQEFKNRLETQVKNLFGVSIEVSQKGKGDGTISTDRQTAFFQARSYLISKKAANYVEQFEGLYAMMRGLGCSLCVGAAYLAGWALSMHRNYQYLPQGIAILTMLAVIGTCLSVFFPNIEKIGPLTWASWLGVFGGVGFWASYCHAAVFSPQISAHTESILWASSLFALVAAAKFFSAYRSFASSFAKTVWRDFSAYLSYGDDSKQPAETPDPAKEGEDHS